MAIVLSWRVGPLLALVTRVPFAVLPRGASTHTEDLGTASLDELKSRERVLRSILAGMAPADQPVSSRQARAPRLQVPGSSTGRVGSGLSTTSLSGTSGGPRFHSRVEISVLHSS